MRYISAMFATWVSLFSLNQLNASTSLELKIGEKINLQGELEVLISSNRTNTPTPTSQNMYLLHVKGYDLAIDLQFSQNVSKKLHTGDEVSVSGDVLSKNQLQVVNYERIALAQTEAIDPGQSRSVLTFLLNFTDIKASDTTSVSYLQNSMPSIANYYRNATYGYVNFNFDANGDGVSDVAGPYATGYRAGGQCSSTNIDLWANKADSMATAAGIDLSKYFHKVYVLPPANYIGCTWVGTATGTCIGANYCRVWIAAANHLPYFVHELGHNLGLGHAGTNLLDNGNIDNEYGDFSDPMGNTPSLYLNRMFNAPHMVLSNWLTYSFPDAVTAVTQDSANYELLALSQTPTLAQASTLQVATIQTPVWKYYLSYRMIEGRDSDLASTYNGGVNIHYLGSYGITAYVATLTDGGAYRNKYFTIKQLGRTAQKTVKLAYNVNHVPVVSIPSGPITQKFTTNPIRIFAQGSDPDGDAVKYAWKLTQGTGGSLSGTNTSTLTLSNYKVGTYIFTVTVTDPNGATGVAAVQVNILPANIPPTVTLGEDQTINLSNDSVLITANASDSDGYITRYSWSEVSGTQVTWSGDQTSSVAVTFPEAGDYVFSVTVTDNDGAQSTAQVTYHVLGTL